jgi:hypothetical protein
MEIGDERLRALVLPVEGPVRDLEHEGGVLGVPAQRVDGRPGPRPREAVPPGLIPNVHGKSIEVDG